MICYFELLCFVFIWEAIKLLSDQVSFRAWALDGLEGLGLPLSKLQVGLPPNPGLDLSTSRPRFGLSPLGPGLPGPGRGLSLPGQSPDPGPPQVPVLVQVQGQGLSSDLGLSFSRSRSSRSRSSLAILPSSDGPQSSVEQAFR